MAGRSWWAIRAAGGMRSTGEGLNQHPRWGEVLPLHKVLAELIIIL